MLDQALILHHPHLGVLLRARIGVISHNPDSTQAEWLPKLLLHDLLKHWKGSIVRVCDSTASLAHMYHKFPKRGTLWHWIYRQLPLHLHTVSRCFLFFIFANISVSYAKVGVFFSALHPLFFSCSRNASLLF